jgi:hypothetical protein
MCPIGLQEMSLYRAGYVPLRGHPELRCGQKMSAAPQTARTYAITPIVTEGHIGPELLGGLQRSCLGHEVMIYGAMP